MHLSIDFLTPRLPSGPKFLVRTAVLMVIALFGLILAIYGFRLLSVAALQVSPALGISMIWPYLAVPVSGALVTFVSVGLFLETCRSTLKSGDTGE
jgi:TRAP-type C4-dicarboxylate transport system permease small subunit